VSANPNEISSDDGRIRELLLMNLFEDQQIRE
jgi:hypothetical protein